MPNWTSNRLYFKKSDRIQTEADLKRLLDTAGFSRQYAEALHILRRAFVLVHSGTIRVDSDLYGVAPLVWQTAAGGSLIDLNAEVNPLVSALIRLAGTTVATVSTVIAIRTIGLEADLGQYAVEMNQATTAWEHANEIFKAVYFDYTESFNRDTSLSEWVARLVNRELGNPLPGEIWHHMGSIVPPGWLPEINGFNGNVDPTQESSYDQNIRLFGTKWSTLELAVGIDGEQIFVDFDTAWSQPSELYYDSFSAKYPELDEFYFAEQGTGFCGSGVAITPGCVGFKHASLDLVHNENDEVVSVSPAWIDGKVRDYGG
jgi:hypothetical protein